MSAGAARARRYERVLWALVLLANYVGIGILLLYGYFALSIYPDPRGPGGVLSRVLVVGLPVIAIASGVGWFHARREMHPVLAWMAQEREPTQEERTKLCLLPRRLSNLAAIYWSVGGYALFAYLFFVVRYSPGTDGTVRAALAILLATIVPWSLAFLLCELALRPAFVDALSDATVLPKTMGIQRRLVLAWIATSGLPIIGVLMVLFHQDATHRVRAIPAVFVVLIGDTIAGITVALVSGRAIIEPISRVRRALQQVEQGQLDVHLRVAESAELGELQVGVNRMVEGLRERERMRDVFGRHVGAEVARRAMETEFGAGGDRCEATAMFVDIIGSTGLTQRKDPDAVVAILNRFFDAVVRVVAAEGGFVNKFQGDGALCLFGTPIPTADHAARGLRAARALAFELAPLGDVAAAIGVSSGEVVAGNVGTADRYEYTVIGDAVNEAARLTEEAKLRATHVLVSERTIRAAGAENDGWSPGETMHLRGRAEPTLTYAPASSPSP